MEKSSETSSWPTRLALVFGAFVLMGVSSFATMMVMHHSKYTCQHDRLSRMQSSDSLHFEKDMTEWEDTERINIEEMDVTVIRTYASDACYIAPYSTRKGDRPLALVNGRPLDAETVLKLAGPDTLEFCREQNTYLLRDPLVDEHQREKRQAVTPVRKSGLNLEYDQRKPRCMDLILDCGKNIGKVQACYTYINGVILMAQKCESATKFTIYMTKPPGRLLKITQQQWRICVLRRQKGLRC